MLSSLILSLTLLFSGTDGADLSGMLVPVETGKFSFQQSQNGVTVTLPEVGPLMAFDSPRTIPCTVKNANDTPVSVRLRFYSTDTIRAEDAKTLEIPAKSEKSVSFTYAAAEGTFSALYPLAVDAEFQVAGCEPAKLRTVRLLKTDLPQDSGKAYVPPFIQVPGEGKIFLTGNRNYTAYRTLDDEIIPAPHRGWTGTCQNSLANIHHGDANPGGETRRALIVHPPYRPKGGSVFMEYPVELPELYTEEVHIDFGEECGWEKYPGKIEFAYGVAIRETAPHEPASDGVTFRVWVRKADETREKNVLLDEIHTKSKAWVDRVVRLTDYADQEIILTLETNPGPDNNTTCDGCFWSGLAICNMYDPDTDRFASEAKPDPDRKMKMQQQAARYMQDEWLSAKGFGGSPDYPYPHVGLELKDGMRMIVVGGASGIVDSVIAIGNREKYILYDGIKIQVDGVSLGDCIHELPIGSRFLDKKNCLESSLMLDGKPYRLLVNLGVRREEAFTIQVKMEPESQYKIWEKSKILQMPANLRACVEDRITSIEFGPASVKAEKIYYGHGYVVKNPTRRTQVGGGGHVLATSHIGFDFENGLSLLMATKTPPDYMVVDPERKIYSLRVHPSTTFTLIPGTAGAMETAIRYRPLFENMFGSQPSSLVAKKAGRLVYDVWGRSFEECRKDMEKAIRYGATDSLFIKHAWQRWGYDVRLPDIWQPQAETGTLPELQALEKLCRKHGIPFALHDNYIDFYPDATDFSYRYITRHEDGTPRLAWLNEGAGAQSFQWRPDLFKPFLAKNLELADEFLPTMNAYFVDVFTSMNTWDFYDDAGRKRSRQETLERWANCFQAIQNDGTDKDADARKYKRPETITISEAGDDFLIGALDGADVQWLELTGTQRDHTFVFPCEDWQRVPWFAPVNHTRFSLHGAGYSGRYAGGGPWQLHNSASDDYISMEILSGNAMMVETWSIFPLAARKTWLAQHVIRRLADKEIVSVEFLSNNIHHQKVTWSDGTTVYVNRDPGMRLMLKTADGSVVLGQYHFVVLDKDRNVLSAICKKGEGQVGVEFSRDVSVGKETIYVDSRCYSRSGLVGISPRLAEFKTVGDRAFQLEVQWTANEATAGERDIFVHIFKLEPGTREPRQQGWVAGGERPSVPTTQWGVETKTYRSGVGRTLTVPEDLPDGDYDVLVGLYDARGSGGREHLMAVDTGNGRYSVAKLHVKRTPEGKMELSATAVENAVPAEFESLAANTAPLTIFGVTSPGPVRVVKDFASKKWVVTPLPVRNFPVFSVSIHEKSKKVARILATPQTGGDPQEVEFTCENMRVTWQVDSERFFDYTLQWEEE